MESRGARAHPTVRSLQTIKNLVFTEPARAENKLERQKPRRAVIAMRVQRLGRAKDRMSGVTT